MQLMGFSVCAILFLILGADYSTIKNNKGLFVLLYGLTFFFSNFGANLTTFVVPAEAFPTRARATCHGISAASGKLGAVLGSSGMAPLLKIYGDDAASKDKGLQLVMYICCGVSLLGLIWTVLFTKETGKTNLEILDQRENNTSSVKKSSTSEDIERQRKMLLQG
jgi:PHS family inorganic phosphate transporter-like MFS transporter